MLQATASSVEDHDDPVDGGWTSPWLIHAATAMTRMQPVEWPAVLKRPNPLLGRIITVTAFWLLLSGCFTGQRPTLNAPPPGGDVGQTSGDSNADAVLKLLEPKPTVGFTARYSITRYFGGVVTDATVTDDAVSRRSVTIGGVRYLSTDVDQTCQVSTGQCEPGLVEARTSDVGAYSGFDRLDPSKRLRTAVSRKAGPSTPSTEVIAGLAATCVTVPVGAGGETYCALATGGLARWNGADLDVELTGYEGVATEALFQPS